VEVDLLYLRRSVAVHLHLNVTTLVDAMSSTGDEADQSEVDGDGRLAAVSPHALASCSSSLDP
jgi:hypothetical protein